MVSVISPFNLPIWSLQKPDESWQIARDCGSLNQVVAPMAAAVLDGTSLPINPTSGTHIYETTCLANVLFSIPVGKKDYKQ